jgi:endonuclease/exonuclease/phosphatase family metal-dependent hydrolase
VGIFKKNDHKLVITNTHFDFDTGVQCQSAKLIMLRLSKISPDTPAILMGDFNSTPHSPCYKIFTGQETKRKEFHGDKKIDFFLNVFQRPFPGTFHGFSDKKIGDHIDWILYRGGLIVEKSEIVCGKINNIYPSDHFPLFALFERKTKET